MFASAPHGFDLGSPTLSRVCVRILGAFFDRIFRPEGTPYKIDPAVPGGAYVDMDGTVLEGPAYPEDPLDVLDPPVLSPRL